MNHLKKAVVTGLAVASLAASAALVATPAQAATMPRQGTIDCAGYNTVGVWVEQPGNSGWAQFDPSGIAGWHNVNWYYNLNGSSYQVHVGCGGTPQNWLTSNHSPWVYGAHDFVCVPGRYCALS